MFSPISVNDFMKEYIKNNPSEKKHETSIKAALICAVEAKKSDAKCSHCGQPIWAIGTAMGGWNGCFTCISGEADCSNDYEIDSVCWK